MLGDRHKSDLDWAGGGVAPLAALLHPRLEKIGVEGLGPLGIPGKEFGSWHVQLVSRQHESFRAHTALYSYRSETSELYGLLA